LIVDSAARKGGTVTARVRLQSFGDTERFVRGVFNPPVIGEQGTCYRSLFVLGGGSKAGIVTKKGCLAGQVPEKDKQVALELSMGDPGGEPLTFIPSDGLPIFGVPSTGTGTEGSADLVDFAFRSKTAAATVSTGEQVSIDLATSVLFALDSAELTPAAGASLNAAVQALQGQSCRRLTIGGHTDSQGEAAYNLTLSQQRAEAVKQALGAKLGAGWTLDAQGFGETELAVKEEGSPEAIAAAQERNRRVEVTACSPA
jgi:outer membrane protein OmpA-like peptidoglycan-associated protein